MLNERLDAHGRVVPPIGSAIANPPRLPHSVSPHAVTHTKLKNARERRRRRHADNKALQNTNLGMRLHDADKAQYSVARHQTVGIERQHQFKAATPLQTEIADVAGFEADVLSPAAINNAILTGKIITPPSFDKRFFGSRHTGHVRIAQNKVTECRSVPGRIEAGFNDLQPLQSACRILVAQCHQYGGRNRNRRGTITRSKKRRDVGSPILSAPTLPPMQLPKANAPVPKPKHGPRRSKNE